MHFIVVGLFNPNYDRRVLNTFFLAEIFEISTCDLKIYNYSISKVHVLWYAAHRVSPLPWLWLEEEGHDGCPAPGVGWELSAVIAVLAKCPLGHLEEANQREDES